VTEFIALYRGRSVAEARLIAVSSEPEIVSRFFRALGGEEDSETQDEIAERKPLYIVRGDEG
jgi:hypothetical protein